MDIFNLILWEIDLSLLRFPLIYLKTQIHQQIYLSF